MLHYNGKGGWKYFEENIKDHENLPDHPEVKVTISPRKTRVIFVEALFVALGRMFGRMGQSQNAAEVSCLAHYRMGEERSS